MSDSILPSLDKVDSLMKCLFGDKVEARNSVSGPNVTTPHVIASYVDAANKVRRVLFCDLALANSMSAAMSMIPAGVASEATKAGVVGDNLQDNLGEILNICVNLFSEDSTDRLMFSDFLVCTSKDPKPTVTSSVKYVLDIPRYPGGSLLAGVV